MPRRRLLPPEGGPRLWRCDGDVVVAARARARARFFLVRVTRLRLFCTQTLENFEGDADIMIVRGRARYIYEVTFKVCVLFLPAALRN